MLVENQMVEITWSNANKKHYIAKGYTFTKNLDKFVVNVKDLSAGSKCKVAVVCDNCGTIKYMTNSDYLRCHKKHGIDLCSCCRHISAEMTWNEKYGVSHPLKIKEIKDKSKNTCLLRYGCENPMQSKEIKAKAENTLFEKYGVYHPLQNEKLHNKANQACIDKYGFACVFKSEDVKNKIKQSCLEKYGVENPMQSLEVKNKAYETNIKKYGYKNPMQNLDIKAKAIQTLCQNGSCPTSSQQISVGKMLMDIYGNCELNYPCDQCSLDCVVIVDGQPIDVEYDGQFWHQDSHKDLKRDMFVSTKGYKILRVKGNYAIPTEKQLKEAIDYLVKDNHSHTVIELDI